MVVSAQGARAGGATGAAAGGTIALLGATGSIGASTLDVIERQGGRWRVHGITANTSVEVAADICRRTRCAVAVMADADAAARLDALLRAEGVETRVESGEAAIAALAASEAVDVVVSAIVGAAALVPTLAAAGAGKRVLLANKEALVMSGDLLMRTAREAGALIMPVDSEHNAIFQSLPAGPHGVSTAGVERIVLTASGGPFRSTPGEALARVTREQALDHPNWSMGPKISVDSATLMNKGLEVIEACRLFGVGAGDIEVLVHPESIVHSMVRYTDGSTVAQLGRPDMRTPIAHALAWPERIGAGVAPLDLVEIGSLHFERPDLERFPALRLAFEAEAVGGSAPAVLNAANEVAVEAFLDGRIGFTDIARCVEATLAGSDFSPVPDLTTIIAADRAARRLAREWLPGASAVRPAAGSGHRPVPDSAVR